MQNIMSHHCVVQAPISTLNDTHVLLCVANKKLHSVSNLINQHFICCSYHYLNVIRLPEREGFNLKSVRGRSVKYALKGRCNVMLMQIAQPSILLVCVLTKQISYSTHSSPCRPLQSQHTHSHTHIHAIQSIKCHAQGWQQ